MGLGFRERDGCRATPCGPSPPREEGGPDWDSGFRPHTAAGRRGIRASALTQHQGEGLSGVGGHEGLPVGAEGGPGDYVGLAFHGGYGAAVELDGGVAGAAGTARDQKQQVGSEGRDVLDLPAVVEVVVVEWKVEAARNLYQREEGKESLCVAEVGVDYGLDGCVAEGGVGVGDYAAEEGGGGAGGYRGEGCDRVAEVVL